MTIHHDVDLSKVLWYHIGGRARLVIDCFSKEDVLEALEFVKKNAIKKIFVCGLGSNLLFSDEYFDGAIIFLKGERSPIKKEKNGTVTSFAGTLLDDLIRFSFDHHLTGLEWAGGLPGTVGAGVRGNVGAFGGEIAESFFSAEVITIENGEISIRNYEKDAMDFSYRTSLIKKQKNMILLSATFKLLISEKSQVERAKDTYFANIAYRTEHHPLEYPSCGSFFKNIKQKEQVEKVLEVFPDVAEKVENKWHGKVAAGYLIQRLGLQGLRIGDAQISEKHALFIVNLGHAKQKDVLEIVTTIQDKFQETFGFTLEPEVEIVE